MKHKANLLWICTLLFLVGCWDNIELYDRGYVIGISIDKAQPIPKGFEDTKSYLSERDLERMALQQGKPKYAYTIQLPIFIQARAKPSGTGGGSSEAETTWDLTMVGNSFMEANSEFATRVNFPAFYEHLQAIVISEEVARRGITEASDFFLRNHEVRRRTKLFITPGEAKKILDVVPRIEDYASLYLQDLPNNVKVTAKIAHVTDLGAVSQALHSGIDFVLPRVVATKDEIKNAGVAVFRGDKMVGWLGEIDTIYLKWVRNLIEGGSIVVKDPHDKKELVTLQILKAEAKVRPVVEGNEIKMRIEAKAVFNLGEKFGEKDESAFYDPYLKELEKRAEQQIKSEMQDTIGYIQEEFGADIFHFGLQVQRYAPKTWEVVKDDWHDVFKDLETEITVKAQIKQVGTMK